MAHIDLHDASLLFRVRKSGRISLKEFLVRQMFRQSKNPILEVQALDRVTLGIGEGDRVGIIGHNGAGKSSLLKVLAGIYPPTGGRVDVAGRVSSLFDISLGFEPEANGWTNIRLRGYLQGETPRSIQAKMASIAEFSELGEFMDMPVRFYSAGMLVRLAFSIATAIEPEILLVDEALAAGDMSFQQKARRRIRQMVSQAKIVVIVSHDLDSLTKLVDRMIWLDHGRIRQDGSPQEVAAAYRQHMQPRQPAAA